MAMIQRFLQWHLRRTCPIAWWFLAAYFFFFVVYAFFIYWLIWKPALIFVKLFLTAAGVSALIGVAERLQIGNSRRPS